MKSCQSLVEKHLLSGGQISQMTAMTKRYDYCGRLSETIRRLRKKHGRSTIKTEMKKSKLGTYAVYKMSV